METWNHRVIRRIVVEYGEQKEVYGIHEVYYDTKGKPMSCTVGAIAPDLSESLEDLEWVIERMLEATLQPVLNYDDF